MTTGEETMLSVQVGATPAAVWDLVRRFGDVAAWNPFLAASRIVAGEDGAVGAKREVVTKDGATARERLIELDDERLALSYEMLNFPIPVQRQRNRIVVSFGEPAGRAVLTFSADFDPALGASADVVAGLNQAAFAAAARGVSSHLGVELVAFDEKTGPGGRRR